MGCRTKIFPLVRVDIAWPLSASRADFQIENLRNKASARLVPDTRSQVTPREGTRPANTGRPGPLTRRRRFMTRCEKRDPASAGC